MLFLNVCFYAIPKTSTLLNVNKGRNSKCVPFRCFLNRSKENKSEPYSENREKIEQRYLTGLDDPNFGKYAWEAFFDWNTHKRVFNYVVSESKRFYNEEMRGKFLDIDSTRIDRYRCGVHMLHTFETPEDVKKFQVFSDSYFNMGFSTASLVHTGNETAVFSGNVCTDVPKSGEAGFAGYATISGPKQMKAFHRCQPYDWTKYTHLVLKIRGDGRTYLVILHTKNEYEEVSYCQYCLPLYTRGGPYWQIAKMPFSHFFFQRKGRFQTKQCKYPPMGQILNLGITAAGYEGPFKLEIDYIGLEFKEGEKKISVYEQYRTK